MSASTPQYLKLGMLFAALGSVIAGAVYGLGGAKSLGLAYGAGRLVAVPAELEYRNDAGESGSIELRLRNEGTRTVKILGVDESCGCTQLQGSTSEPIEPGQDATLGFRVSPPLFGSQQSLVKIQTDSAETPIVQVSPTLYGKKLTPSYVSDEPPPHIRVQTVADDVPPPQKFRIATVEVPGDPWLTGIDADADFVTADPPTLIQETSLDDESVSRRYEITLNFQSPPAGESHRTVRLTPITRTEPIQPFPAMTVTWQQVEALRAAPASLLFSFAAGDAETEQQRRLVLIAADDAEWSITSIASDADWLRAEAVESESQNRQLNVVCAKPAGEREPHESATLRVATDHPRCPEVRVRVNRVNRDEPRAKNTAG